KERKRRFNIASETKNVCGRHTNTTPPDHVELPYLQSSGRCTRRGATRGRPPVVIQSHEEAYLFAVSSVLFENFSKIQRSALLHLDSVREHRLLLIIGSLYSRRRTIRNSSSASASNPVTFHREGQQRPGIPRLSIQQTIRWVKNQAI
ncbi:Protein of unknown function, partial [Gryllus bimaculatus]